MQMVSSRLRSCSGTCESLALLAGLLNFTALNINIKLMKLTDERLDEITSEILKKAGKSRCPICGSTSGFTFPENEFELLSATKEGQSLVFKEGENDYFRLFPLTCDNCGFVANFNLQKIDRFLRQKEK